MGLGLFNLAVTSNAAAITPTSTLTENDTRVLIILHEVGHLPRDQAAITLEV
jgi:hypothetical protein